MTLKKKLWMAEYRQRPEVKARTNSYWRAYRSIDKNRKRINDRTREWRKRPGSRPGINRIKRAWAAREKAKAIEYKGGNCVCCGYSGCAAAMDFHHKNPHEKNGYGTGALKSHWTFERNKPELDKCVLVCVRCHREIHAGYRTVPCAF